MKSKNNFLYILVGILCLSTAQGQHLLGVVNSNYAGTNALYMNPAHIADNRYGFYMNFISFQAGASNNALYYKGSDLINGAISGNLGSIGSENFKSYGGSRKRIIQGSGQVRVPFSFMAQVSPKVSFAVTSRVRAFASINQIPQTLVDIANTPNLTGSDFTDKPFNDMGFNMNANVFAEFAASYAQVAMNKEQHFLKVGGTFKYLKSAGGYAQAKDIDFLIKTNQPTSVPNTFQDIVQTFSVNASAGSSVTNLDADNFKEFRKQVLGGAGGFGLDMGAVYEFRPDWEDYTYKMNGVDGLQDNRANKYLLKVGVSLMDMGGVRYRTATTRGASVKVDINELDEKEQELIQNNPTNADSLRKAFGSAGQINEFDNFRAGLPTTLNLTVDYKIAPHLYANLTYIQNLRGRYTIGARQAGLLALTPRVEFHGFELAFPISLQNNMTTFAFGTAIKLGPMFIGSDHILGALNAGKINGVDVYFGLSLPIRTPKKPKDKDLDGISDKLDECKEVQGVWEFKGCPDSDKDGIQDKDDACPSEAGLPAFKGCPDKDSDGVQDKEDECPDIAGLPAFKGCPDKDSDGVQDKEDECPDVAGLPEFKGCPDKDNDKVQDKEDACPDVAGLVEYQGCPDTDGDRIQDKEDDCPEQAGLPQFKGCPDTDADGIMDKEDNCPTVVGVRENKGCPEEKKDAPPVLTEEEKDVLKEVFESLEFEYGKAVIAQKSQASLKELAEVLKKKKQYRLSIEGHTDNVGNAQANLKLSQDRAKAVKAFLEKEGVKTSQLMAEGFGDKKPIADNKTEEGRKKNRRVEFKIVK
jgi:outer membrane protein OmpA-like peptidoglycan-associated protein